MSAPTALLLSAFLAPAFALGGYVHDDPRPPEEPAARKEPSKRAEPEPADSCGLGSAHAMMRSAFPLAKQRLAQPKLYSIQRVHDGAGWLSAFSREFVWEIVFFNPLSRKFMHYYHGSGGPLRLYVMAPLREYDGAGRHFNGGSMGYSAADDQLYKVVQEWNFDRTAKRWVDDSSSLGNAYLRIREQACGQIDESFLDSLEIQAWLAKIGASPLCEPGTGARKSGLQMALFHPLPQGKKGACRGYSLHPDSSYAVWSNYSDSLEGGNLWGVQTAWETYFLQAGSGKVLKRK